MARDGGLENGGGQSTANPRATEILEVAARLFAVQGFAGTRMSDVASGIGVTKPIVYRFYKSKQELFEAVVQRALQAPVVEALRRINALERATPEVLAELPDGVAPLFTSDVLTMPWIVALGEANKVPQLGAVLVRQYGEPLIEALARLFDRTRDSGGLVQRVDSHQLAWLLVAPAVQLVMRRGFGMLDGTPSEIRTHLQVHVDGFCKAWLV